NEEEVHPWRASLKGGTDKPFNIPFLRLWDCFSGSQPDENNRMLSRAPRQRLRTASVRKETLAMHLDHKIWEPTPYISFQASAERLEELANMRNSRGNRGVQFLTVIDPDTRLRRGFPILDVAAEMRYYGIQDPYGNSNQYYINHYVCLWEVTGKEVVGHWEWDDLAEYEDWYRDIIMPAFRKFRRR
ncbi:hypothetical protein DM02DRAFT_472070, partial [Periconia macrospinosa]